MSDPYDAGEWMLVKDAAEKLGIKESTLRVRMSRETVRFRKGNDGRSRVFVHNHITDDITNPVSPSETAQDAIRRPAPQTHPEARSVLEETISGLRDAYEARIDDLKGAYEGRIDELRAVTVELADRHEREVERLLDSHANEITRMVGQHLSQTEGIQKQLDRAGAVEGEVRAVLLDLLNVLGGPK